jgi:nucleoside triphosphate pyrophosphatase
MSKRFPLILASASPTRLILLKRIFITPDIISPTDIDETAKKDESARQLAMRLAKEKAYAASKQYKDGFILAADTVVACGKRILDKAYNDDDVRKYMELSSGRNCKVISAVYLLKKKNGEIVKHSKATTITILKFKRLSEEEINLYIRCKEGIGKAGGCFIEGVADSFVKSISGSYSGIQGLPLYQTKSMLIGMGYMYAKNSLCKD